MRCCVRTVLILLTGVVCPLAGTMEIEWARMTGQYPVENAPLVADVNGDGAAELVAVNGDGQVLLWSLDGAALGPGQDGAVAQLPPGRWSTSPQLVDGSRGPILLFGSVEGLVVALDGSFQQVWEHKLPGETTWGRALPTVVQCASGPLCCIADHSGTVTCLTPDGSVALSATLSDGPCRTFLGTFQLASGEPGLLVPVGTVLCALDLSGQVLWRRDLGGEILTKPEALDLGDRTILLCGAGSGSLFALTVDGDLLWETPIGDATDASISFLPRGTGDPLILCTGLWGNLHAVDTQGRRVWTHEFRAKTRCRPLVLDADGDGHAEIFVTTYSQRVYVFSDDGRLVDAIRLGGIVNSSPVPVVDADSGRTDITVVTSTLMAYRLRCSAPRAPYAESAGSGDVRVTFLGLGEPGETPALLVENPHGGLIVVNVAVVEEDGPTTITGYLGARSVLEIPLPETAARHGVRLHATVEDGKGRRLAEEETTLSLPSAQAPEQNPSDTLRAWPTPAYGTFDAERYAPASRETLWAKSGAVEINNVYGGEVDQGAFVVASRFDDPIRARVTAEPLTRSDGASFAGSVTLREVVATGTVNGERAWDALPELGDGGLVVVPARGAVKIWVSVDAHNARPGAYEGALVVQPLFRETEALRLPLKIDVLDLALPDKWPLTLCTWDYVPNNWFPERTPEVLDDMACHGVNVFPRSNGIPEATMDDAGRLEIDWSPLDAELDRLAGRGCILFQLGHPPISFPSAPSDDAKRRAEIDYLLAFRDHLRERGWAYEEYAFYPVDEPGLDHGGRVPVYIDAAELFREADPNFRIYTDPVPGLSWADFERIEPLVDVWCPNMRLVSGLPCEDPRIRRIVDSGKTIWSYECVSQVKSLSPLRYNRANAWRACYFGLDGIGFWTHSTTNVEHWLPGKTTGDEYALVYPGATPVPSARWEAVRDGLEDVAAMAMLDEEIRNHRGDGAKQDVIRRAEDALRIARTDVMELSDEAFIESRDFLREGDRILWHTWTDVTLYGHHRETIAQRTLDLRK